MKFKRFMALALAGVITFAMAGSAYADDAEPKMTKKIVTNDGVTVPASTLTFIVSDAFETSPFGDQVKRPEAVNGWTVPVQVTESKQKEITINDINLGFAAKLAGKKQGEYVFKVTEEGTTAQGYGWQYNTGAKTDGQANEYWVRAFVPGAAATDAKIKYFVYNTDNKDATDGDKANIEFANKFTKKAGDDNKAALTISKTIGEGKEYANKDDVFRFKVSIKVPDVKRISGETSYSGIVGEAKTAINVAIGEDGTGSAEFDIKADEKAEFADIPAGAYFMVEEIGTLPSGYEKDATTEVKEWQVIDENGASATITNNYKNIPVTGLAISVAPFIAMFAAVGAAIALYVAAKRRVR